MVLTSESLAVGSLLAVLGASLYKLWVYDPKEFATKIQVERDIRALRESLEKDLKVLAEQITKIAQVQCDILEAIRKLERSSGG